MAEEQPSELLRALEQLNEAAWAQTLLPLLKANKSAGAFALACQQLRQLVHDNQRELKLTGANCKHLTDPWEFDEDELPDTDALCRPFPAASSVEVRFGFCAYGDNTDDEDGDHDDAFYNELQPPFEDLLPMLARLPHLTSLLLDVQDETASQPANIVKDLQQLRLQLPQLRLLQLSLRSGWTSSGQQAWAALGATTQLTKLVVEFSAGGAHAGGDLLDLLLGADDDSWDDEEDEEQGEGSSAGISLQHLSALQPLSSSLQHLELKAPGLAGDGPHDYSFLSSFSGLTSLRLPLSFTRAGLAAALGGCTGLQELRFDYQPHMGDDYQAHWPLLDAAECAALAQLTQLTYLDIPAAADTPALLSALQGLQGLAALELLELSSSHLPVLATLTQLTGLGGSWVSSRAEQQEQAAVAAAATAEEPATAAGAAQVACPSVLAVWVSGPFPLAAFPGAKTLTVDEPWRPSRLVALSKQMQQLESLTINQTPADSIFHSLDPSKPKARRVAAVRSLKRLPHLTKLQFAVNDDAEAAALAAACKQLKELCVRVPYDASFMVDCEPCDSSVTAKALWSLFRSLTKLRTLSIVGYGLRLSQSEATRVLKRLAALPELQELHVSTARRRRTVVWERAAAAVRKGGLALPAVCDFSVATPDCPCEECWAMAME